MARYTKTRAFWSWFTEVYQEEVAGFIVGPNVSLQQLRFKLVSHATQVLVSLARSQERDEKLMEERHKEHHE